MSKIQATCQKNLINSNENSSQGEESEDSLLDGDDQDKMSDDEFEITDLKKPDEVTILDSTSDTKKSGSNRTDSECSNASSYMSTDTTQNSYYSNQKDIDREKVFESEVFKMLISPVSFKILIDQTKSIKNLCPLGIVYLKKIFTEFNLPYKLTNLGFDKSLGPESSLDNGIQNDQALENYDTSFYSCPNDSLHGTGLYPNNLNFQENSHIQIPHFLPYSEQFGQFIIFELQKSIFTKGGVDVEHDVTNEYLNCISKLKELYQSQFPDILKQNNFEKSLNVLSNYIQSQKLTKPVNVEPNLDKLEAGPIIILQVLLKACKTLRKFSLENLVIFNEQNYKTETIFDVNEFLINFLSILKNVCKFSHSCSRKILRLILPPSVVLFLSICLLEHDYVHEIVNKLFKAIWNYKNYTYYIISYRLGSLK